MTPTPGKQYIVVEDDTLEKLASSAYGNPTKWPLINDVNQTQFTIDQNTQIPVGLTILIPIDNELNTIRQKQFQNGLK